MVRLWFDDRPLYTYQHYWVAGANQVVAAPANPRRAIKEKRQDQSTNDTPPPSCLASMTATDSVSLGSMNKSGAIPASSAVSGSSAGTASGLSSSAANVSATTTAASVNVNAVTSQAAASLAAISKASVVAVNAAQITMISFYIPK